MEKQEKAQVGAFSVTAKLQTSRRFVSSSNFESTSVTSLFPDPR